MAFIAGQNRHRKPVACRTYLMEDTNGPWDAVVGPVQIISVGERTDHRCNGAVRVTGQEVRLSDPTMTLVVGLASRRSDREPKPEAIFDAIKLVAVNGWFRIRVTSRCLSADEDRWTSDISFLPPEAATGKLADIAKPSAPQFARSVEFSNGQKLAFDAVQSWLDDPNGYWYFKLNGGAGTGKTTIAKRLAEGRETVFGAYTGKAVKVLQSSGIGNAGTIHGLLATPNPNEDDDDFDAPTFVFTPREWMGVSADNKPNGCGPELLIVDEHSMIGHETGNWIKQWATITGGRVLLLGDDNQLEPVGSEGFFTFCRPDVMLTEIHRQAEGSPVLAAAQRVLDGHGVDNVGPLPLNPDGTDPIVGYDMTIVATNKKRRALNERYRHALGIPQKLFLPVKGEPLQVRRNSGILKNGEVVKCAGEASIVALFEGRLSITVDVVTDEEMVATVSGGFDYGLTDGIFLGYGYAITVFKAQGSQADRVYIDVDWLHSDWDGGRALYTAITRAKNEVRVNCPLYIDAPAPINYREKSQ